MAKDHGSFTQALGPGGAYIIALEHLQHAGAHQAHEDAEWSKAEGQGWKEGVVKTGEPVLVPADEARGGKPADLQGKGVDQQDSNPETRDGNAGKPGKGGSGIGQSTPPGRGNHSQGNADGQGDGQRHQGDL